MDFVELGRYIIVVLMFTRKPKYYNDILTFFVHDGILILSNTYVYM